MEDLKITRKNAPNDKNVLNQDSVCQSDPTAGAGRDLKKDPHCGACDWSGADVCGRYGVDQIEELSGQRPILDCNVKGGEPE